MRISHSGTVATSRAASPDGTLRSPTETPPFPPASSKVPTRTADHHPDARGRSAARTSGPPERSANGNISSPATT